MAFLESPNTMNPSNKVTHCEATIDLINNQIVGWWQESRMIKYEKKYKYNLNLVKFQWFSE